MKTNNNVFAPPPMCMVLPSDARLQPLLTQWTALKRRQAKRSCEAQQCHASTQCTSASLNASAT
eukprot:1584010-Amphidinium_carterae.1